MTLYTLVETAEANGIEPYWYLPELFKQLPMFDSIGDYDELLPWKITLRKPEEY